MGEKLLGIFVSGVVGLLASSALKTSVLLPAYAGYKEELNGEFVLVHIMLSFSFALSFYFLTQGLLDKTTKKRWATLGFVMPSYFTFFSLVQIIEKKYEYADFWVITIGSLLLSIFTAAVLAMIFTEGEEHEEIQAEKKETVQPIPAFHASEALVSRIEGLTQQLKKAKEIGIRDIETVHAIEKMEQQLLDSQAIFMRVGEVRKQEAEEMLEVILSTMEQDAETYIEQHNAEQLHALEKILIQRQQ